MFKIKLMESSFGKAYYSHLGNEKISFLDLHLKEKENNIQSDPDFAKLQNEFYEKILKMDQLNKMIKIIKKKNKARSKADELLNLENDYLNNKNLKSCLKKDLQLMDEKFTDINCLKNQLKKLKNSKPQVKIIDIQYTGLDKDFNSDSLINDINNFNDRTLKKGIATSFSPPPYLIFELDREVNFEEIEIGPLLSDKEWNSCCLNGAEVFTDSNDCEEWRWKRVGIIENNTKEIKRIKLTRSNAKYIKIDHRNSGRQLAIGYFRVISID